jgi:UDP-N-acetylmuramoyl-tripeptide--D-alanyl-D-alanine ligase
MPPFADQIAWKLKDIWKGAQWRITDHGLHFGARLNRARLKHVTFVAVTGTAGKTTTKDLAAAILASTGTCNSSLYSENSCISVDRTVLATRTSHRFCVVEASGSEPGYLVRSLRAIQPRIAAVTVIGREHYSAFQSLEAIAAEKGRIVDALPPDGVAVLNIDDPFVRAMGRRHDGPIIWVGKGVEATLRLLECNSVWPQGLQLRVWYQGRTVLVQTRLHGTHLVVPVLTALGIALAAGLPLGPAVAALAQVEPPEGRMQAARSEDGVDFIRDDWKAPQWSLQSPLDFLRGAQAKRKVVVLGTVSDSPRSPARRYSNAARDALAVADLVVVVGAHAHGVEKVRVPDPGKTLRAFANIRDAADFLRTELQAGDLVLLKGTNTRDHLVRLVLDRGRRVECWQSNCGKPRFCSRCPELYAPAAKPAPSAPVLPLASGAHAQAASRRVAGPLVVGLGNPGVKYDGTPHNAGYAVLDALAPDLQGQWQAQPEGLRAEVLIEGMAVTLFKPASSINRSGPQIAAFLARTLRSADECVIIHDDMDLELGTCRTKTQGGDGGHKGVQSIIAALGKDKFQRVRVGVRPRGDQRSAKDLVLAEFVGGDAQTYAQGIAQACSSVATVVKELEATPLAA